MIKIDPERLPFGKEVEVSPGIHFTNRRPTHTTPASTTSSTSPPLQQYEKALLDLSNETLLIETQALLNSYFHLIRSNQEMEQYILEFPNEDQAELIESLTENEQTLDQMELKLEIARKILIQRGHQVDHLFQSYDQKLRKPSVAKPCAENNRTPGHENHDNNQTDGVYL
jgi:hypothetical protein